MRQIVFLSSSLWGLLIGCLSCSHQPTETRLPYYNAPDFSPIFLDSQQDVAKKVPHMIGTFSFTDQNGAAITQKTIEGNIHVADFFFTSCGAICPKMTKHMQLVEKAFPDDDNLVLLSYSVTPWIDSVARLKTYCRTNGIQAKNWHFLTGNKSEIYQLARQSYFAEEELGFSKDSTNFLHTEHFLLVDKHKRIRGIYNGTLELEMQQLIADIRTLKKETD
ncbi:MULTISPECIES: SCO family protein [unclassified Spirosoma]|uniref:SCO family protein n=1 Tax=unclassified Spirosoma TaxID=2621999 RepID=UPI000963DF34|nr:MULTISPECIES: SCO family protein [unclassified Spirosoma]MBN8823130.1 SCO family protein [Spirosoma sp.]OJW73388.1 MAG: SCO family protein [Spirosoma sp. 48-14]